MDTLHKSCCTCTCRAPAEPYLMPWSLALLTLVLPFMWILLWLAVGLLLLSALVVLAWLIVFS